MNSLDPVILQKIEWFEKQIKDWNCFSLVAKSTIANLWGWHFVEALSILHLVSSDVLSLKCYDFGAGGGVIGYVLYLCGVPCTLIERSSNKLFFLRSILKYESVVEYVEDFSESLVIVRGVSSIVRLLRFLPNARKLILFKSLQVKEEIFEALKKWDFEYELFHRVGYAKGYIVFISEIKKK